MSNKNTNHHPKKKKKKVYDQSGTGHKITEKEKSMGKIYIAIVVAMGLATAVLVIYGMS